MGHALELRFITDEDVPRSTARVLHDAGFDVVDVRDVGLRGESDSEVFACACARHENRLLITCDMGFSNILNFPPSGNRGFLLSGSLIASRLTFLIAKFYAPFRKLGKIYCIILPLLKWGKFVYVNK
jgi:hypothetical protein